MYLRIVCLLILVMPLGTLRSAQAEPVSFIVTITNMAGVAQNDDIDVTQTPVDSVEATPVALEDDDTEMLAGKFSAMPLTAVIWLIHGDTMGSGPFFTPGEPDRGDGLEALAEDGAVSKLALFLENADYSTWGVASIPDMEADAGPLIPSNFYTIFFDAVPGERLSFVTRFTEANDLFFAPDEQGIALFTDDGQPINETITRYVYLWDAGTEVNEEPLIGENQGPRQPEPNTGPDEDGTVRPVDDEYAYPPVAAQIRVSIEPNQ